MMSGKMGDVAPMTEMLKWASAGETGLGLFVATWAAAADQSGPAYRYWARYNSLLEQKLRPMFIFMPPDPMSEKCTHNLPTLRVSESLAVALMKLAARDERVLSDYLRRVLTNHVFGHGATVQADDGGVE